MKKTSTKNTLALAGKRWGSKWLLASAVLFGAASFTAQAQAPTEIWDKAFGGSDNEYISCIQQTPDGGYILGGMSASDKSGDKTEHRRGDEIYGDRETNFDYWVVKVDAKGNKQWDKTFGGNKYDGLRAILQTADGGYILGGTSGSDAFGDKSEGRKGGKCDMWGICPRDYWVVKIDAAGNKQWDRTYGGSGEEDLVSIVQAENGNYILAGNSGSVVSGDKTIALPGYWLLKIDASGNPISQKGYFGGEGGPQNLVAVQKTADGGYMLGGYSRSGVGRDKSEPSRGEIDYWMLKLDAEGNKQWDKTLGGLDSDVLTAFTQTADKGYILTGYTYSKTAGGDKSEPSKGEDDFWVVKIDAGGNKQWDRTLGGESNDNPYSLLETTTGSFIIGGQSYFKKRGSHAGWVISIDANGKKQWDKTIGGDNSVAVSAMLQAADGSIMLGGLSSSETAPIGRGLDYWLVKLSGEATVAKPELASFSPATGLPGTTVTLTGKHFKSTSAVLFNGVAAKFKMVNDCKLTAVVPASATTGLIEVKTNGGSVLSKEVFTVLQPAITRYAPQQGRAGTTLILTGEHLATAKKVLFNGVATENFTFLVTNSLSVIVPEGATTGKITVELKGGGKAVSTTDFVIRPAIGSVATATLNEIETAAYPNPFVAGVTLPVTLDKAGSVRLLFYNTKGQQVKELNFTKLQAGEHKLEWDGKDNQNRSVTDGLYFYRLSVNGKLTAGQLLKSGKANR